MRSSNLIVAALLAAALPSMVVLPSCAQKARPYVDFFGKGPVVNPFIPALMTIHPLTRVDKDPSGKLWIYCHVEFKDSWGDTVKAAGSMEIQLIRSTGLRGSGQGKLELVWKVELSDLEKNASLYDPATRTYRLPLENPPEWVAEPTTELEGPKARLHAVFTTQGAKNDTGRKLEDEFALGA